MSLHHDLLEQAEHLVVRERRRPRQASLRRAISAAYYALFHLLIAEASTLVLPDRTSAGSRSRLGRTFGHAEMKRVAQAFSSPNPRSPAALDRLVQAAPPIPPDLATVAEVFVDLQDQRHEADYNTANRYTRQEASAAVASARRAIEAWGRIRSHPVARTFLVSLVAWNKWDRL